MKFIWIAISPDHGTGEQLVDDIGALVRRHGGRVDLEHATLPAEELPWSTRFRLIDLARAARAFMSSTDINDA